MRQRWNGLPLSPLPFTGGVQAQAGQPQLGISANITVRAPALCGLLDWIVYDPAFLDKLSYHKGTHLGPYKAQDHFQLS